MQLLLLTSTFAQSFARNWQPPFLNQRKKRITIENISWSISRKECSSITSTCTHSFARNNNCPSWIRRKSVTKENILWSISRKEYCSLTRTYAQSLVRKWQLPFLNQRKGENDCGKYFMINLQERMLQYNQYLCTIFCKEVTIALLKSADRRDDQRNLIMINLCQKMLQIRPGSNQWSPDQHAYRNEPPRLTLL